MENIANLLIFDKKMKVPIIGAYSTGFGDLWDKDIGDLLEEAGINALKSAGISAKDVDALYIANVFSSKINGHAPLSSLCFERIGISRSICISSGDASGAVAIEEAANLILSGAAKYAMVIGAEKSTDLKTNEMLAVAQDTIDEKEESFIGATVQSLFAIITRKYMSDFGFARDDLSFITINSHKNGATNEFAQFRFELDINKINSSAFIADPIKVLDCSPYCDGASAIILCSNDAVEKRKGKVLGYLLGSGIASMPASLSKRKSITRIDSTANAAAEAYKKAGLSPKEIGLIEAYDIVPVSGILSIEDMGFADKGKGIEFIKKHPRAVNPSGGLKSCGHAIGATGIRQAVDIIKKLKEMDIKFGISNTMSGTGSISAVNIYGV